MSKRNVATAGAVLMLVSLVAKAEAPPVHGDPVVVGQPIVRSTPQTEAERQAKLFQLVNACLLERPGAPSAADEILRRFRSTSN